MYWFQGFIDNGIHTKDWLHLILFQQQLWMFNDKNQAKL